MAVLIVLVKLASLVVEEMAHVKVTDLVNIVHPIFMNIFLYTDIDECTFGTHSCDQDAMCTNTDGSFTCACYPGSTGDGLSCGKYVGEADSVMCPLVCT
jgi:hypothetical protein